VVNAAMVRSRMNSIRRTRPAGAEEFLELVKEDDAPVGICQLCKDLAVSSGQCIT